MPTRQQKDYNYGWICSTGNYRGEPFASDSRIDSNLALQFFKKIVVSQKPPALLEVFDCYVFLQTSFTCRQASNTSGNSDIVSLQIQTAASFCVKSG
jgi:hypothetical protein